MEETELNRDESSSRTLEMLISDAKLLVKPGDASAALLRGDQIVRNYADDQRSWLFRGYLRERSGDLQGAIEDIGEAISLNPTTIHSFYTRGRCYFQLGRDVAAVADFTRAIELCDLQKDDYYADALFFERAETFLRLGRKADALADIRRVPDGLRWWTFELRSKEDVIMDCLKQAGDTGGPVIGGKEQP